MSQKLSTATQLVPAGKVDLTFSLIGYPVHGGSINRHGIRLQGYAHLRRRGRHEAGRFLHAGGRGALHHAQWGRLRLKRDAVGVCAGAKGEEGRVVQDALGEWRVCLG